MNFGIKNKPEYYPTDVYLSHLNLPPSSQGNRWGMTDDEIKKLPILDQRNQPACTGYSVGTSFGYNKDKDYSKQYIYVNADRLYEGFNKGGLHVHNALNFLKTFGAKIGVVDNPRLSIDNYYTQAPYPSIDGDKITGYTIVNSNIEAIKQGLASLDGLIISVYQCTWGRERVNGKRMYRFRHDTRSSDAHAMMVTHMIKESDGHYLYLHNSWGDGQAVLKLEDFPQYALRFDGYTYDKKLGKDIVDKVEEIKQKLPEYTYFKPHEIVGLKHELVLLLDKARDIAQIPFVINSGFRTVAHNKAVGGVDDSSHTTGEGVDISAVSSLQKFKIIESLIKVGFTRIGIYKNHIHCDISKDKPSPILFLG